MTDTLTTDEIPVHEPYEFCDGRQAVAFTVLGVRLVPLKCEECYTRLCDCQIAYGHDCY